MYYRILQFIFYINKSVIPMRILPRFFIYANELLNYSILYKKLLSNMQSIDSLRELNAKLLAEICELRKENAEIKAENIEVKAENAKLKHALEEHEARFTNLEQRDKEKTTLIAKLDDDIREIKQEQNAVNISAQSNTSIPKSPIHSITSQSSISPSIEGIAKQSDHSDHSIEKNNADPISQDFDSIGNIQEFFHKMTWTKLMKLKIIMIMTKWNYKI